MQPVNPSSYEFGTSQPLPSFLEASIGDPIDGKKCEPVLLDFGALAPVGGSIDLCRRALTVDRIGAQQCDVSV